MSSIAPVSVYNLEVASAISAGKLHNDMLRANLFLTQLESRLAETTVDGSPGAKYLRDQVSNLVELRKSGGPKAVIDALLKPEASTGAATLIRDVLRLGVEDAISGDGSTGFGAALTQTEERLRRTLTPDGFQGVKNEIAAFHEARARDLTAVTANLGQVRVALGAANTPLRAEHLPPSGEIPVASREARTEVRAVSGNRGKLGWVAAAAVAAYALIRGGGDDAPAEGAAAKYQASTADHIGQDETRMTPEAFATLQRLREIRVQAIKRYGEPVADHDIDQSASLQPPPVLVSETGTAIPADPDIKVITPDADGRVHSTYTVASGSAVKPPPAEPKTTTVTSEPKRRAEVARKKRVPRDKNQVAGTAAPMVDTSGLTLQLRPDVMTFAPAAHPTGEGPAGVDLSRLTIENGTSSEPVQAPQTLPPRSALDNG